MALVWGQDAHRQSGNIRTHIYALRRMSALADRIRRNDGGYLLEVRDGESDLDEFRLCVADGTAKLERGRFQSALAIFEQAVCLWREPELADFPFTPRMSDTQAGLRSAYRQALRGQCVCLLELRRHDAAIVPALRLVTADPNDERACQLLMLALYRSGKRAEAVGTYLRVREMLADGHGLDPGPALQRLHMLILRDDPSLAGPGASALVS